MYYEIDGIYDLSRPKFWRLPTVVSLSSPFSSPFSFHT